MEKVLLSVCARQASRWRAGHEFGATPRVVALTPDQAELVLNDPLLSVSTDVGDFEPKGGESSQSEDSPAGAGADTTTPPPPPPPPLAAPRKTSGKAKAGK